MIRLIKFTGKGYEGGTEAIDDGLHLPAASYHDVVTLCGLDQGGGTSEQIDGVRPTCKNCIDVATQIVSRYSKAQVLAWK